MSDALVKSTDLDFNKIKDSLKTYFKSKSEFTDYNFDASGLSNILDVLAYNTHINGLIANVGINESFLGSAQLRSSVVSHAEALGYYPRSRTAAAATVSLKVATTNTTVNTLTLPVNTAFSASVDDVSYTFQTTEEHTATNDGSGNFQFTTSAGSNNIVIKEGLLKTKTFLVGDTTDEQVYIIPDETIDTATLTIKVFDTNTSSTFTTYTDIQNSVRINSTSTIFIVRESPNGFYELTFSDGNVLGKAPSAGNKIVATYLSTKGAPANGATSFTADDQITVGTSDEDITVTVVNESAAGAEKETIDSIKANAPVAFASQQRLVTAEDYKALILSRYSSTVQDVTAWGGNDNIPANYGAVYVSINFKSNVSAASQTTVKNSIKSELSDNLGIMSIDTIFSDPIDTFLEVTTSFNFDPDLTGDTQETTQTRVQNLVNQYFTDNLSTFDAVFRRSLVLAEIDDLDPAILNSSMVIKVQQAFQPTLNFLSDFTVNFPVALAQPDDVNHIVQSGNFTSGGKTAFFRNKLKETKLELVDAATGDIIKDNAGTYSTGTGEVKLVGVEISGYTGDKIKVSATPNDQSTIKPLRNYILKIDTDKSASTATVDFQNTSTSLST